MQENHSHLEMNGVTGNDLNVKNQLYKRGGTTVTGTEGIRDGAPKYEDSESYRERGMTIDASNHTLGGANKNQ